MATAACGPLFTNLTSLLRLRPGLAAHRPQTGGGGAVRVSIRPTPLWGHHDGGRQQPALPRVAASAEQVASSSLPVRHAASRNAQAGPFSNKEDCGADAPRPLGETPFLPIRAPFRPPGCSRPIAGRNVSF